MISRQCLNQINTFHWNTLYFFKASGKVFCILQFFDVFRNYGNAKLGTSKLRKDKRVLVHVIRLCCGWVARTYENKWMKVQWICWGGRANSRQWGHACVLNKRSTNFGDSVFATMKFVTQMIHFTHGLLFLFSMRTMVKIKFVEISNF